MNSTKLGVIVLLAAALMLPASAVSAATTTANLAISTTVSINCAVTAGVVSFGSYDPVGTNATSPLDANGAFTVACTQGATSVTIDLSQGGNYSSGRRLTASGSYVSYELYSDSARSVKWGSTSGGSAVTVATPASTTPVGYTAYGRIPAGQDVPTGNYSDTVVATVNF